MKQKTKKKPLTSFLLHLHPKTIDSRATQFNRTFGLGGMAALLCVLLFISGLALRFLYIPSIEGAYNSTQLIRNENVLSSFIRNIHYWSANALIVISILHLIRVFYTVSIVKKRGENWIYGIILLFIILASSFTGYLLPMDQLAYWAITITSNLLGYFPLIGPEISRFMLGGTDAIDSNTLLQFYTWHTGMLPLLLIGFISIHFWLIRKSKGIALPINEHNHKTPTNPELVYKELVTALALTLSLVLLAMLVDAPLLSEANPLESPNPAKAPWYFMGYQELLIHLHPVFALIILPTIVLLFILGLPYLRYKPINTGQWFNSVKNRKITIISAIFSITLTFSLVLINTYIISWTELLPNTRTIITSGLLSFLMFVTPVFSFLYYLKKQLETPRIELVMSLFTIIISSYFTLTLIGCLLRGEGMTLLI